MHKIMLARHSSTGRAFRVSLFVYRAQHQEGGSLDLAALGATAAGARLALFPASRQEWESCLAIYL